MYTILPSAGQSMWHAHSSVFLMRGSFPPTSESFTGIWSIWAIWSKLVGSARRDGSYIIIEGVANIFHLSILSPIIFVFVSFIQFRARKIQMSFFNVESIGSIFIVLSTLRMSQFPENPGFPCPMFPLLPKVRRRRMKKLFLWTFVRHFKWCICCNEINLLRNWMVKGIEVKGLFFKCELDNMFLYA